MYLLFPAHDVAYLYCAACSVTDLCKRPAGGHCLLLSQNLLQGSEMQNQLGWKTKTKKYPKSAILVSHLAFLPLYSKGISHLFNSLPPREYIWSKRKQEKKSQIQSAQLKPAIRTKIKRNIVLIKKRKADCSQINLVFTEKLRLYKCLRGQVCIFFEEDSSHLTIQNSNTGVLPMKWLSVWSLFYEPSPQTEPQVVSTADWFLDKILKYNGHTNNYGILFSLYSGSTHLWIHLRKVSKTYSSNKADWLVEVAVNRYWEWQLV